LKFKKWIKTTTICSSFFWLETLQSENQAYCSDFQITSLAIRSSCIDLVSCPQLELTLKSELSNQEEAQLSFKFGIPQVKKDLKPLLPLITKVLMVSFSFMISLIDNLSRTLKTGLPKSTSTEMKTWWKC